MDLNRPYTLYAFMDVLVLLFYVLFEGNMTCVLLRFFFCTSASFFFNKIYLLPIKQTLQLVTNRPQAKNPIFHKHTKHIEI